MAVRDSEKLVHRRDAGQGGGKAEDGAGVEGCGWGGILGGLEDCLKDVQGFHGCG